MTKSYDAILIVSFGAPESPEEVMPFLENVTRGRNVPRKRLLGVAEHYEHVGGVSPLNAQVRALIERLRTELERSGPELPLFWGNRNWHPLLADTLREMADAGHGRILALVLSAYSSYSGCRQYREDIEEARRVVGPEAPVVDKIRVFYNHPDFIVANADCVRTAMERLPGERRDAAQVVFTAHSIPARMADSSDYEQQLNETCRLVSETLGLTDEAWRLVYQSRSGRPSDPWLEPDIVDHLKKVRVQGLNDAVIMPIGFLSDHMEVVYDLDIEACGVCEEIGLNIERASTVGTHPRFIAMLCDLIDERISQRETRQAVGQFLAAPDQCPETCCAAPKRRPPTSR
jgi:protoporphyrin/coproporphyrin ferrochelatase